MATQETRAELITIVVAMFDAAPGVAVLSDLTAASDAGNSNTAIAASLANSAEFKSIFPTFQTNAEFVSKFVDQMVGSLVSDAEKTTVKTALTAEMNAGATRVDVVLTAVAALKAIPTTDTVWGNASAAFTNKVEVATYHTVEKQQPTTTLSELQGELASVTNTAASVTAAKAELDGEAAAGTTTSLTTGVDNLTGTIGQDTFIADNTGTNNQLGAADQLNGGANTDTLKIYQKAATDVSTTTFGNLTSVESLYINSGTLTTTNTLDVSTISGVTSVALDSPAAMADGTSFTVKTSSGQSVSLTKVVGTTGGATSTFNLNGTTAATLNGVGTDLTLDLTSTGKALTLTGSGASSTVTLANTGAALATLNLAGDQTLSVTTSAAALKTVASTSSGNVTLDNTGGVVETYTGGAGKDTVTVVGANVKSVSTGAGDDKVTVATSALAAASTVDLGAGDDSLVLLAGGLGTITAGSQLKGGDGSDKITTNEGAALTAAQIGKVNAATGFETLGFATTASGVDVSALTSINKFSVENTGTTTFTKANDTSTFAISNTAGVTAVSVGNAVGETTSTITVDNQAGSAQTLATLTVTGITTVNLASTGKAGSSNVITTLSNSDNTNLVVTGSTDLTITNALAGTTTGSKVDASAFTGKLTVIGSGQADILIGGSKVDTITGGVGADTLTGGAGIDVFEFAANGSVAGTDLDKITDFNTGGDKDNLGFGTTAVLLAVESNGAAATSDVDTTAGGKITFAAADDTYAEKVTAVQADAELDAVSSVAFFEDSGNTYVYYAGAATGNADDQIIQLTGVTGLTTITVGNGTNGAATGDILIG